MDLWAAFLHRFAWHGPLWGIHRTHHARRPGRFERNDALSGLHAPIAIVLIVAGSRMGPGLGHDAALGIGAGMTAFGALYLVIHDGLVHARLPVRFLMRLAALRAVVAAHREHHRRGRAPYGILFGPWELAISRRRARAASTRRRPPPNHRPTAPP
jgi:beta-carotene 3-hydroxylase